MSIRASGGGEISYVILVCGVNQVIFWQSNAGLLCNHGNNQNLLRNYSVTND